MKFAVHLPNMGLPAQMLVDLAVEAENIGWDGVFIWDSLQMDGYEMYDPYMLLATVAAKTSRVRLGPIITPLARRRPWKVAKEMATLDHLSNGRMVLMTGMGSVQDGGFERVGEVLDLKKRAKRVDEALEIITRLWSGERVTYAGEYYQVKELEFRPKPIQSPIPIWVVGVWPRPKSMARPLRYQGLLPGYKPKGAKDGWLPIAEIPKIKAYIDENRSAETPFDIVVEGDDCQQPIHHENLAAYAAAGTTWYLDSTWKPIYQENAEENILKRIRQGPPTL